MRPGKGSSNDAGGTNRATLCGTNPVHVRFNLGLAKYLGGRADARHEGGVHQTVLACCCCGPDPRGFAPGRGLCPTWRVSRRRIRGWRLPRWRYRWQLPRRCDRWRLPRWSDWWRLPRRWAWHRPRRSWLPWGRDRQRFSRRWAWHRRRRTPLPWSRDRKRLSRCGLSRRQLAPRMGWGWPVALGLSLGAWSYPYYSSYYSDPCIEWDGYQWVNICYSYY